MTSSISYYTEKPDKFLWYTGTFGLPAVVAEVRIIPPDGADLSGLLGGPSPIDREGNTGYHFRSIAGKETGSHGDVLYRGHTVKGSAVQDRSFDVRLFFQVPGNWCRQGEGGGHGVYADIVRCPLYGFSAG